MTMLLSSVLSTTLGLAVLGTVVSAQVDAAAQQPTRGDVRQGQGVLGSVNGQAITSADLTHYLTLRTGIGAELDPEMIQPMRRQIAEQILQASEAERLGIDLSDVDVENYWEQYLGAAPDFESLALEAGSTADRQRALARRSVLAEIFLYHKVGIWAEYGALIKPDPVLEKLVDVTPGELRDLFREQREQFEQPASVSYTFYPCESATQAETIRQGLLTGQPTEGLAYGTAESPLPEVPQVFAFSDELVSFLQTGVPGQVSKVFETGLDNQDRAIIFTIESRQPARSADFREVQEDLRRYLQVNRLDQARRQLVSDLQARAVFWPRDLFEETISAAPEESDGGP